MQNHSSTPARILLLFGASVFGLLVFAGLYFFNPRTVQVEVPKEVEKIVNVPVEIHIQGVMVRSNAATVEQKQMMSGLKDVAIFYRLYNAATQATSADDVRAKFEQVLKNNNIPMDPNKSEKTVLVEVDGYWDQPTTLTYNVEAQLVETRAIPNLSEGSWSYFGHVGKDNANKGVLNDIEKVAEMFANDFRSANSKDQ